MRPTEYNAAQPWARQPCDDDADWLLFQDFLSMKPRNVGALARRMGVNWTVLEGTAWENGWNTRAALWDDHLDRLRRETIENEVQEDAKARARRHMRYTGKAGKFIEKELDRYLAVYGKGEMPVLKPRDLIRWLALTVRTERLAAGDATEVIGASVDLSGLSLEELRALRELQSKTKAA